LRRGPLVLTDEYCCFMPASLITFRHLREVRLDGSQILPANCHRLEAEFCIRAEMFGGTQCFDGLLAQFMTTSDGVPAGAKRPPTPRTSTVFLVRRASAYPQEAGGVHRLQCREPAIFRSLTAQRRWDARECDGNVARDHVHRALRRPCTGCAWSCPGQPHGTIHRELFALPFPPEENSSRPAGLRDLDKFLGCFCATDGCAIQRIRNAVNWSRRKV